MSDQKLYEANRTRTGLSEKKMSNSGRELLTLSRITRSSRNRIGMFKDADQPLKKNFVGY